MLTGIYKTPSLDAKYLFESLTITLAMLRRLKISELASKFRESLCNSSVVALEASLSKYETLPLDGKLKEYLMIR